MSCVLAIDVGTGSVKAGVFDCADGAWVGFASRAIAMDRDGDRAEQDAGQYWSLTQDAVGELRAGHAAAMLRVKGVCVTGQMRGLILVGEDHEPLGPAITLFDGRAARERDEFLEQFGLGAIHRVTGQRLDGASVPAKLRWLRTHQPDLLRRARWVMTAKDYVRLRMTGIAATEPIDAAGWLLLNLSTGAWDELLVGFSSISLSQLPSIVPSCSVAGPLLPEIAAAWGLDRDVVVAVGGGDDIAATGSGAWRVGDVYEHLGSTGSIFAVTDRVMFDSECVVECYPTERPGRYWMGGSCNAAGVAIEAGLTSLAPNGEIDWLAVHGALTHWSESAFGGRVAAVNTDEQHRRDTRRLGLDQCSSRPLYLPYIGGERCPVWRDGVTSAWVGRLSEHSTEQLTISVFEGVSFLLAWVLAEVRRVFTSATADTARRGGARGAVYSAGKAGEDDAFAGMRATMYDLPVHRLVQPDAALFGAALIAAVVVGEVPNIDEGLAQWSRTRWLQEPVPRLVGVYRDQLSEFQRQTRLF